MLVKFVKTWFAPSEARHPDKLRVISGQRYRAGVHEVPDRLKPFLPKTCTVMAHDGPKEAAPEASLVAEDLDRAGAEALSELEHNAVAFSDVLETEEPVKRGRGRPKKT